MVAQKKKTTKKVAPKATKKSKATKNVAVEIKKTAPALTKKQEPEKKETYEVSKFFYGVIVFIVVLLYAELTALTIVYFFYDVTIVSNVQKARVRAWAKDPKRIEMIKKLERFGKPANPKKLKHPAVKCPEPVARKVSFNEEEYLPYAEAGNAVIEGTACFELNDGTTKCFENANVFINPVTTYSDEWYNRGWAGREFLQQPDERALKYNKKVRTDKDGNYKFTNLKPGSYYIGADVCLPEGANTPICHPARYAAKVKMKNHVKPTLKKVFP